jgi:hypothetical protein
MCTMSGNEPRGCSVGLGMMTKPMDPADLAELRGELDRGYLDAYGKTRVADLLADRDYHAQRAEHFPTVAAAMADLARTVQQIAAAAGWPADMPVEEPGELVECVAAMRSEVALLRVRVRVCAKDVPEIQPAQIVGYLVAGGWSDAHVVARDGQPLWTVMLKNDRGLDVPMLPDAVDYRGIVARIANELAMKEGGSALDILDAMAAMEVDA